MLTDMRDGETAKDVARRIIGPKAHDLTAAELQRITEQVRYWAKIDALTPSTPGSGTGHWKTFDEANVYTAAVLFEFAKYAPRWGFLTTVGQYLWAGVSDQFFYIDPDDPNEARVQRLKDENAKLQMIFAARGGESDVYLGASSPSTWDTRANTETSSDSDADSEGDFPLVTAAEKAIAGEGRILVTKGAPTPPPMTSMIVVNLSEIFAMVRRSYEERPLKQNNTEKE